jgi:hypothetical protein
MKTIVIASTILIALLMSLNVLFACDDSCNYRTVVEEDTAECKCAPAPFYRCGGSGVFDVFYECYDPGGDCGASEECVKVGEKPRSYLLIYGRPVCGSTDPLAPYCDEDDDCEIESWLGGMWVHEPICQCMTL